MADQPTNPMKHALILLLSLCLLAQEVSAQKTKKRPTNVATQHIETVTNPLVKSAIVAINERDSQTWYALFTPATRLSDDGRELDFRQWSERELFGRSACRIISVDKLADNGLSVYCLFHSDSYGDFKTFMRFQQAGDKLTRLDVGQTNY